MSGLASKSEILLPTSVAEAPQHHEWKATIGLGGSTAIVVGSMLGIGIFLNPPIVASHVPNAGWFLGVWVIGGLMAFFGALSYGELGSMYPQAGGDYVFLKEAYGRPLAFLFGWAALSATFSGSIATTALGLGQYYIAPFIGAWFFEPFFTLGPLRASPLTLTAVGLIFLFTVINMLGISFSAVIQSLVSYTPFVVLAVAAVWSLIMIKDPGISASATEAAAAAPPTTGGGGGGIGLGQLGLAMLPVFFAYSGWNSAAYIGSEIKNAKRTLPLALIFGIGLIVILYLLLNSLFIRGTSVEAVASVGNVGLVAAERSFGDWGAPLFTLLTGIAIIGGLNSTILIGPRIYYSMARDGLLFKTVGTLCPRRGTPKHGLLIQAVWASVLVHLGGFETILNYTTLMIVVLSSLTVGGLFILRRKRPDQPRGFRVPLYPLVPLLYIAMSVFLIVILSLESQRQIVAAALMIALGLAGYAVFSRLERRRKPATLS
ncbi:MAG: hypothetical protein CVU59_08830 [Deltaproteobacteria bacterium HGW-Deltaproteobacteria-17]|nr:MAG: hypothetical protein CVU59_08830 [Deltaproteobacteria bacterium HGW-Deltaproteobacteria-17]